MNNEIEFVPLKNNLLIKRKYFYKDKFPNALDEPFLLMNGRLLSLETISDLIEFQESLMNLCEKPEWDVFNKIVKLNQKFQSENL